MRPNGFIKQSAFYFLMLIAMAALTAPSAQAAELGWRFRSDLLILGRTDADSQGLFSDLIAGGIAYNVEDFDLGVDAGVRLQLIGDMPSGGGFDVLYSHWSFDDSDNVTGVADNFNPIFAGFEGFGDIQMFQTRYFSETHGVELNRRVDVDSLPLTFLYGLRYASIRENAMLRAQTSEGIEDMINTSTNNDLFGVQMGFEGVLIEREFVTFDSFGKIGLFHASSTQSTSAREVGGVGTHQDFGSGDNAAMIAELGVNANVRLTKNVVFRAGYLLNWVEGVALAPNQWDNMDFAIPTTGVLDKTGGFLTHGGLFGLEVIF